MRILAGLGLLVCTVLTHGQPATTVLECERLIDVTTGQLLRDQHVTISGNKIVSVGAAADKAESVKSIALNGMTCMPGLMDMHVHLLSETGPQNYANQFRLCLLYTSPSPRDPE